MIKVLSIGNSFSEDAQRYIYGIARADGIAMKTVNLYIGGCDFEKHYRNMLSEKEVYDFQINGINYTRVKISMKDALFSDNWDYITLQQQSRQSCDFETFEPYLDKICEYVKTLCPKAKLLTLETWGYKEGSEKLFDAGYDTHEKMYADIREAYRTAAERIKAYRNIPVGEAVLEANRQLSGDVIHRDEYHLSNGFGRYLAGLVVYRTLTGNDVTENSFCDFDVKITKENIALAKNIANRVIQ